MHATSLDEQLARWRIRPSGSARLARAVAKPGRPAPLVAWSAVMVFALVAGGVAGRWANQADRQSVIELHVSQMSVATLK